MQRNAENKSRFGNKLRRQLESAGFMSRDSFGVAGDLPSFLDVAAARNTNGDLEADFESRVIKKKGAEVCLTPNEFKIFSHLAKNHQRAVAREELAVHEAIGTDSDVLRRVVDSHVKNLRKKIEDNSKNPKYIITVRNVGYRFAHPDEKAAQKEI